ncbi:putative trans-zeatin O-beta-D-glucosyltransferase [Helianthus annuus]|nr:putative trans-zeatin O-beta-D-glucosyltransferase [Helianthus annuus]KAJ0630510.1 putative trans-zeatin O-beta-D-glucosyltransferase [Helianthus annuus]
MDNETQIKKQKLESPTTMESSGEILVLPFFGTGHINPSMELCRNISSHNFNVTLIIPTHLSSSIPSTFSDQSPFIHVAEIPFSTPETGSGPPRGNPLEQQNKQMGEGIKSFLSTRSETRPVCAVVDVMMSSCKEFFVNYQIPVVSFSTSGAAFSAMAYGRWKAKIGDLKPGETRELPGLPKEMATCYVDLFNGPRGRPQRPNRPPGGPPSGGPPDMNRFGSRGGGPPGDSHQGGPPGGRGRFGSRGGGPSGPDSKPRWVDEVVGSVALLINTCDRLDRLFIDYIGEQTKLPVWGIGPLLPEKFWKSAGSILHDHDMRSNRKANYTEDEVFQWLESKPKGSVIYISFGSEVGPSIEGYKELAKALEESNQAFIWVIQPGSGKSGIPKSFLGPVQTDSEEEEEEGYYPEGLDTIVGDRGLIITGWAPQLLILSHPSTGGFLSHCGWNSTVEAIGRGVPILGWPLRGDQFDNAKLVANHLKIGFVITSGVGEDGRPRKINKDDIASGVEKLMSNEEVHEEAKKLSKEFESGFPVSSVNALGAFVEFISQKAN